MRESTVVTYGKALVCVAKQAQRHLGRDLTSVSELYENALITALVKDEVPLVETGRKLAKNTLRQRRRALRKYLVAVVLPGRTFEEANEILDQGLRSAATRRGSRLIIEAGLPMQRRERPGLEDVEQVIRAASVSRKRFAAARNVAVLELVLRTGLRRHSVIAIDGADFSSRHGQLFLMVSGKGRAGRSEIEVPAEVAEALLAYVGAFNGTAMATGWAHRIGIGEPGPFWRGTGGRPMSADGMSNAIRPVIRRCGSSFQLHGLRHLYAALLLEHLNPGEAALAGGWQNDRVFLRYYARSLHTWGPQEPQEHPPGRRNNRGPEQQDSVTAVAGRRAGGNR